MGMKMLSQNSNRAGCGNVSSPLCKIKKTYLHQNRIHPRMKSIRGTYVIEYTITITITNVLQLFVGGRPRSESRSSLWKAHESPTPCRIAARTTPDILV